MHWKIVTLKYGFDQGSAAELQTEYLGVGGGGVLASPAARLCWEGPERLMLIGPGLLWPWGPPGAPPGVNNPSFL